MDRMIFPKSKGGLWAHNKTSEKQPDVKGHVEITRDVLRDRTAKSNGARYIYLTTEAYVPKEHQDRVNEVSGGSESAPPPTPVDYVKPKDPWG